MHNATSRSSGCTTGCTTRCTTSCTTGCTVVQRVVQQYNRLYNRLYCCTAGCTTVQQVVQPVVQLVVQLVVQPVVQPVVLLQSPFYSRFVGATRPGVTASTIQRRRQLIAPVTARALRCVDTVVARVDTRPLCRSVESTRRRRRGVVCRRRRGPAEHAVGQTAGSR